MTGNGANALSEAGVPPVITRWSADRVLQELRQLDQQGAFEESSRIRDGRLANAASRYFGSKRRALIAAGVVAAQEVRRCWSKWPPRRIIEALQDRHIRGLPLRGDANLVSAANRRFGSFYEALIAAGIQTEKPTPRQRWSRQRVIDEMRVRHARGLGPGEDWTDKRTDFEIEMTKTLMTEKCSLAGRDSAHLFVINLFVFRNRTRINFRSGQLSRLVSPPLTPGPLPCTP